MENSKIEWTDHTASPWYGCEKVAAGCEHCYAEALSLRNPGTLGIWGAEGVRVKSKSFIANLRKWQCEAARTGKVVSVFPSLCDPFEDRPELEPWRQEMFAVIDECPNVRLLLLTKRPENIRRMWQPTHCEFCEETTCGAHRGGVVDRCHRSNFWLGTSIATQADADANIPALLACRGLAPVLFVSAEPLLGSVDLATIHQRGCDDRSALSGLWKNGGWYDAGDGRPRIDWLIVGGESGPHARPMHPDWARSLRDQCQRAGVPFFFKQWGEWLPFATHSLEEGLPAGTPSNTPVCLVKSDGRVFRPYSFAEHAPGCEMARVGKKAAGRALDGRTWDAFPKH